MDSFCLNMNVSALWQVRKRRSDSGQWAGDAGEIDYSVYYRTYSTRLASVRARE